MSLSSRTAFGWMNGLELDVRLGLRMLRKSWALTLVGGLAMTVTIGLGASMHSVWSTLSATALPFEGGDRVIAIQLWNALQQTARGATADELDAWRTLDTVERIGAFRRATLETITPTGPAGSQRVAETTASGFALTGVQPIVGRTFAAGDERVGADPVAVIGAELWQSGFASDPAVIGRSLQLDGVPHTVVGVMPQGFGFPVNERVWIPLPDDPSDARPLTVFGRLAPGATLEQATTEVSAIGASQSASARDRFTPRVVSYVAGVTGLSLGSSWVGGLIFLLAALLLVPPAANIAVLVYTRTVTRRAEFAARYALGASRRRIVGQVFVELLVLMVLAGTGGILLARAFAWQLAAVVMPGMTTASLPFWMEPGLAPGTVVVVVGLAVVAALIAGGMPALQATGRGHLSGLHALSQRTGATTLATGWNVRLALQVAFALAVIPSAIEVGWPVVRSTVAGPGLPLDQFVTGSLTAQGPASRSRLLVDEMVERLRADPGVAGVTVSASSLLQEGWADMVVEGGDPADPWQIRTNRVDDAFFETFDAALLAGRALDDPGVAPDAVVIVNRRFAREVLGDANVLGRRIRYTADPAWYEIAGVVEDFPAGNMIPTVYHPLSAGAAGVRFTLRARPGSSIDAGWLDRVAREVDPALRVGGLQSVADSYRRFQSVESTFVAVLSVVIFVVVAFSVTSLYTVTSFTVLERRREIGLRAALGAAPRRVMMDMFGRTIIPAAVGVILGGAAAVGIDRGLPIDDLAGENIPGIVFLCSVGLAGVWLAAVAGPARRLLRIDPADALRDE